MDKSVSSHTWACPSAELSPPELASFHWVKCRGRGGGEERKGEKGKRGSRHLARTALALLNCTPPAPIPLQAADEGGGEAMCARSLASLTRNPEPSNKALSNLPRAEPSDRPLTFHPHPTPSICSSPGCLRLVSPLFPLVFLASLLSLSLARSFSLL